MNMKELTLLNFSEVYPDEETCVKPCAASARIIVLVLGQGAQVLDMQPLRS